MGCLRPNLLMTCLRRLMRSIDHNSRWNDVWHWCKGTQLFLWRFGLWSLI